MLSGSWGILLFASDTSENHWFFHSRPVLSLWWELVVFPLPCLTFLTCAFPPQKVEGEKKWCWDKLEMVLVFSSSRNLLCISMAHWMSISTWGAHDHFGEISLCFEMYFEATQCRSCSHPGAQLLKAALFVSHYSLMILSFWDLSGTFFYCHLFLGSSLRLCLLVCFCILKPL